MLVCVDFIFNFTKISTQLPLDEFQRISNQRGELVVLASKLLHKAVKDGSVQYVEGFKFLKAEIAVMDVIENNPSTSGESKKQESKKKNKDKAEADESFQWEHKSNLLLLTLRFEMNSTFIRPPCKKIKLWQRIANKMVEQGYKVSGPMCDQKYRAMLASFKKIKKRLSETGTDGKKTENDETVSKTTDWEYYDLFLDNIGYKDSINVPVDNLGSTFDADANEELIEVADDEEEDVDENVAPNGKKRKRDGNKKLSAQEYHFQKLKADKERDLKQLALEEKRLELEAKRIAIMDRMTSALETYNTSKVVNRSDEH